MSSSSETINDYVLGYNSYMVNITYRASYPIFFFSSVVFLLLSSEQPLDYFKKASCNWRG